MRIPTDYDKDGFEQFWARYPRRDARIDAYKAWRQKQPSEATKAAIFDALTWQIPLHQWEDRRMFCPLPASYLRGERWTDERPCQCVPAHRLTPFELARRAGLK